MFGTYVVTLDSGAQHTVTIDNRDFIAFRRRGYRDVGLPSPDVMSSRIAAMANTDDVSAADGLNSIELIAWMLYNAGDRAGYWSCDYETFSEKECVSFAAAAEAADARGPYRAGIARRISELAVTTGIAPSVLWDEDPRDLATMIDVLHQQAEQQRQQR